jgi:Xaa-Pro aminopeptidase
MKIRADISAWFLLKMPVSYLGQEGGHIADDIDASEYLAPCDARRAHLTSFDGSAGTAVITQSEARCWTDGRYWLQAEKQLGEGYVLLALEFSLIFRWTLVKHGLPDVPTWGKWLKDVNPSPWKSGG